MRLAVGSDHAGLSLKQELVGLAAEPTMRTFAMVRGSSTSGSATRQAERYGALNTSAQLVPPKPKELFISARMGRS